MTIGSMVAAVMVLAVVILVHELGHFLVGKLCDVEVRTFSMGIGPTLYARQIGETVYRVALIPFGGYVHMAGYDEEGSDPQDAPADPSRGFTVKPIWQRAAIVLAGPVVNMVFAAALLIGCAIAYGVSMPASDAVVAGLTPGFPAEAAGLRLGDRVVSVDGSDVKDWDDLVQRVLSSGGRTLAFDVVGEDGQHRAASVTPKLGQRHDQFGEATASVYQIGIQRGTEETPVGVVEAVTTGVEQTWGYASLILTTVTRLFQGRVSAGDLGGPILIAREAGRQAQEGLRPLLLFMALISVNLGVVNILPIPVLDGGHLAFMAFEAVRGRPLSLKVREYALSVGMVLIGTMMIFVVFNDLFRIVTG